jgi:deazaflavin-dependent oxidoreductase (nitroreductase family)
MNANHQFLYLTTTGRKSGLSREIEIWFVERDGRFYILAEHGHKAQWVQNILANPRVHVRIGDEKWDGVARVLDPEQDADDYLNARRLEREKYGWGEGLPIEITLSPPFQQ